MMAQLLAQVDRVIQRESEVVQDALSRNDVQVLRGRAKILIRFLLMGLPRTNELPPTRS
jgi:pyruvate/2-oxoglutarate dehydrogenase complex dihydrolipoamide dehydrogenase (E3) component